MGWLKRVAEAGPGPEAGARGAGQPAAAAAGGGGGRRADPCDPRPRAGYLSWDDYFMGIAFLSAQRSKDPNKQVGACIVGADEVIVGIGYNGFPRGCDDSSLPWAKKSPSGDPLETKVRPGRAGAFRATSPRTAAAAPSLPVASHAQL